MRLLFDAHLPPAIASQLTRTGVDAVSVRDWMGGNYRTMSDDELLTAAASDERVLVTYDLRTIPRLLKEWTESGRDHAGVILIDDKTIRSNDIDRLITGIHQLAEEQGASDWRGQVTFLRPHDRG